MLNSLAGTSSSRSGASTPEPSSQPSITPSTQAALESILFTAGMEPAVQDGTT